MRNTTCACGSACIVHDAARTSQHPTPNDATSGASDATGDAGAVFISARLADYGRLADRLATLATSAYIVTRRHPDDLNAAATLRELLALALDAHRASITQNLENLRFVDLRGREVDAADWHDLERMRDTSEALRHILARLTQMTAPEPLTLAPASSGAASAACERNERTHVPQAAPDAQQTARKRRHMNTPTATLDALLASSGAATQHRKGHTHA